MRAILRPLNIVVTLGAFGLALCACDNAPQRADSSNQDAQLNTNPNSTAGRYSTAPWPRTISGEQGAITITQKPQRIVSTSVSLTGALLTIEAPVIASGASQAGTTVTDHNGFFTQWAALAVQKNVRSLYQGEADAEIIASASPDLIIISGTGGDSALKLHQQLSQIAPTLVLNYDNKSWQELARILGYATGNEQQAEAAITRFAKKVEITKTQITHPPQPVTAMVYYEDGSGANIWTQHSAQGQLLTELGFDLAPIPDNVRGEISQGLRKDIVQVSGEKFADALQGQTIILFSANTDSIDTIKSNPFLGQTAAVRNNQVYAVGLDTFRLDYYSANNLLDRMMNQFQLEK